MEELLSYGLTSVYMIRNYDWRTGLAPPGDWANFSRFWIVIDGHTWTEKFWGSFTWGSGTWGSTATQQESSDIRAIIKKRKAAHDICPNIIVVFSEAVWGQLNWGDFDWGGRSIQWPGYPA